MTQRMFKIGVSDPETCLMNETRPTDYAVISLVQDGWTRRFYIRVTDEGRLSIRATGMTITARTDEVHLECI